MGQQSFSYLSGLRELHLSNNPVLSVIDKGAFLILPNKDLALEEVGWLLQGLCIVCVCNVCGTEV